MVSTQAASASCVASTVRACRVSGLADDIGDVLGLLVQHVREVGGEARLGVADDEAVGEAAAVEAVQGRRRRRPTSRSGSGRRGHGARSPSGGCSRCRPRSRWRRSGSRARIPRRWRRRRVLGDPLDALAVGVDQRDVRPVEGVEIFVVEAGPLAELVVLGLQRLGGGRVLDHAVHPGADLLHLLEVGQLHQVGRDRRRLAGLGAACAPGAAGCR